MKQVEVTILGQSYILGCPDGGEGSLLEAVAAVDREMSSIRDGGKVKARERIAVLAALNLAFSLFEKAAAAAVTRRAASMSRPEAGDGDEHAADVDIDGLIERLDMALGSDGQLL
ncbi:MAG: cell division protein ZapA [Caldimonas sp.]